MSSTRSATSSSIGSSSIWSARRSARGRAMGSDMGHYFKFLLKQKIYSMDLDDLQSSWLERILELIW